MKGSTPSQVTIVVGMLIGALVCFGLLKAALSRPRDEAAKREGPAEVGRTVPLSVRPVVRWTLPVSAAQREWVDGLVQPLTNRKKVNLSVYLHLLRVHGLSARFKQGELRTSSDVLELLTDAERSRQRFGTPAMLRTRTGVRYLLAVDAPLGEQMSPESHRDQCLAAFAELGVPLSQPLRVDGETLSLRDVLRDSVDNFYLKQEELQWTALAYALYLPPRQTWTNRFGETYSFDELTEELLTRSLHRSACAGTHFFYTLTILARVDRDYPLWSPGVRARAWERLRAAVQTAVKTQEPAGTWLPRWCDGLEPSSPPRRASPNPKDVRTRLLVTSHIAEWLLRVPDEIEIPEQVWRRSVWWLVDTLRDAPRDVLDEDYCPYAHAACVLRQTTTVLGQTRESSRARD